MFARGDGVGVEFTQRVVRGARLTAGHEGRVIATGEVAIVDIADDRSVADALVRLRAELGNPSEPTRVATFPPASTLHRVDITGWSGTELNAARTSLDRRQAIASSVILDDGPRRWLFAVRWDEPAITRIEELVERAGFRDIAVEPSPVAVARVLHADATRLRRIAATDEAFEMLCVGSVPVVAASVPSTGRPSPDLQVDDRDFAVSWFDGVDDPVELVSELGRLLDGLASPGTALWLAETPYPAYPPPDLRSPQRQCVALGAAVGAAGLAGRLRPVDMLVAPSSTRTADRPWAVERVSTLPPPPEPARPGPLERAVSRLIPRRG